MKRKYLLGILIVLFVVNSSFAEEAKRTSLKGVEFLTGFIQSKLRVKGNYRLIPIIVDFDFDLKPLLQKIKFDTRSLLQFQLEPYIAPVCQPDANVELGNSFALKIGLLPDTSKFQPYLKAGLGMAYMTQHTREQGTQFNFTEFGGVGMHYFFKKNVALTVEYRFRHLSNCGIDDPNSGINSHFALMGVTYQF